MDMSSATNQHQIIDNSLTNNVIRKEENVVEIELFHRLLIAETYLQEENTECTFSDFKYSYTSEKNTEDVLTEPKIKKEVVDNDMFANENHAVVQLSSSKISNEKKQKKTCPVCRKNYSTNGSLNVHIMHFFKKCYVC